MAQAAPILADSSGKRAIDGGTGGPNLGWARSSDHRRRGSAAHGGQPDKDWVCVLNALPAGLLLLDEAGDVTFANEAANDLLERDVTGRVWRDLIAELFDPQPDDGHDISTRGGRRVSISTRPLPSGSGQLLLFSDVTETRQLQGRIATRERLSDVGQMAAGLVHQIRTPVASAMLYASQLASAALPCEARRSFANKLLARLHELESLVRELLVFTRGGGLRKESIAMDDLLGDLRPSLIAQLEASAVSLAIESAASGVMIRGNREALLSALQNPVLNAVQAGARNVEVNLFAPGEEWVDVCIIDDGDGIPADQAGRVFEPFYTTRSKGTGLGLAMVRIVAEAHGGRVWAESGQSTGTAIRIRLPRESRSDSKLSRLARVAGDGGRK